MERGGELAPAASRRPGDASAETPLVTVVVPVLNGQDHLRTALDSLLAQTYPAIELLLVDDGSTDDTPAIARSYGDRLRYVRQTETLGIYASANTGIAEARGALVGVFHADDVYLPELVEREVEWLQRYPEAGAVFCSDVFVDEHGSELGRLVLPAEVRGERPLGYADVLNALLRHKNAFLRCPTALVRASTYAAVGVYRPDEFKNTSDVEMWLRIARSYSIGILEEHLLLYRRGHGSSSERYHRLRTDPERFFRILDLELERGGRDVAEADALAAFEAHRAEDTLMRAVNHYILGDRAAARATVADARPRVLLGSRRVQRVRLTLLALGLRAAVRLPRLPSLARAFERRWHRMPARQAVSH
jgi:glycosyltransferase involved in cell wall biosynthesis